MLRRSVSATVLVVVLLAGLLPLAASAAETPPLPASIASVGDSITQAMSSGGSLAVDYPANAWSTGMNTTVNSHYLRLLALNPAISGRAWNDAVSGAKVADLNAQMAVTAARRPDYLTVLIGGNDLCTSTVAQMTSVADFRARFTTAMDTLTTASPDTRVLVASIPKAIQLWELFKSSFWARSVWSLGSICQSLLANPTSTAAADVARRGEVAQRNIDFNVQLAEVCALYPQCRFDGNAVYNVAFARSDVSGDYFHPSIAGQAKLASVTWAAGYWPNGGPVTTPPISLGSATGVYGTRKSGWTATVTVSAASQGTAVAGAVITGTWSGGGTGTGTCTTATNGTCAIVLALGRKATSVTWTVGSVTKAGYVYDPAGNAGSPVTVTVP